MPTAAPTTAPDVHAPTAPSTQRPQPPQALRPEALRPEAQPPNAARRRRLGGYGWALGLLALPACFAEPLRVSTDEDGSTGQQSSDAAETTAPAGETSAAGDPTDDADADDDADDDDDSGGGATAGSADAEGSTDDGAGSESGGGSTGPFRTECDDAPHAIFVNFDGVTLSVGPVDDAPLNETSDPSAGQAWAPYGSPDRDTVYQTVVEAFAPFGVCVTDTRPSSGDYSMVVVTADAHPSGALATVLDDCGNASGNRDIGMVLAPIAVYGTEAKGYVIASVIGALLGLGLVDGAPNDIMKADIETNDSGLSFGATCYPLSSLAFCGATTCTGAMQSSRDYLEMIVGPA